VEKLTARGLLKVVYGTDTLGVGNVLERELRTLAKPRLLTSSAQKLHAARKL
jgi:superfamily II RNA helicase